MMVAGAVYAEASSSVRLYDSSRVETSTASAGGGAVIKSSSIMEMFNWSSVVSCSVSLYGAGVWVNGNGELRMSSRSSIKMNRAPSGAGVFVSFC